MSDHPTIEQIESVGKWVSARTAKNIFGFAHDLLSAWRRQGCPQIRGGKIEVRQVTALVPGIGTRLIWFYRRETLAAIAKSFEGRSRKGPAPYGRPRRCEAAAKKTKRKWANHDRFTDTEGREWVAPRIAATHLNVGWDSLQEWQRSGCPYLDSGVLSTRLRDNGFGQQNAFYLQSELDDLKQNLCKLRRERRLAGSEQMTLAQAAKFTGLHENTLWRMGKSGELTESTILVTDKTGHVRRQVALLRSELAALKALSATDEAEYVSVAKAARQLKVAEETIREWTRGCFHLGRPLGWQDKRVALGRKGRRTARFVSAADVRELRAALQRDVCPPTHNDGGGVWLPLKRAVQIFDVTPSCLQNLRLRGLVKAKRIEVEDALAKRGRRYVYLQQSLVERFGPRDAMLSHLINGETGAPGSSTTTPPPANGASAQAAAVLDPPSKPRGKRGPKLKKQTLEIQEFCYVEYRLKDRKRANVFREAVKRFDNCKGAPKKESHVTTLAERYANKFSLPVEPDEIQRAGLLRRWEEGTLRD